MSELRFDPVTGEWVATATHRMDRPQMPSNWCPFCPGSGRVPDNYDVHIYPNDFPTFATPPPEPDIKGDELHKVRKSFGFCDVVLYHPDHKTHLMELEIEHIIKLVKLWQKRFLELMAYPKVKYVFIFENNGEEIGVTMPHPHGQIYSFPFVPPIPAAEIANSRKYFKKAGRCIFCDLLKEDEKSKTYRVLDSKTFAVFVPYAAKWPYEVHMIPKRHVTNIAELTQKETAGFASILRRVLRTYHAFYGFRFPYMMAMHQAPKGLEKEPFYHFHVEFYPVHRSRTKLKFRAGCETGAGLFINDSQPEEKARELLEYAAPEED